MYYYTHSVLYYACVTQRLTAQHNVGSATAFFKEMAVTMIYLFTGL